MDNTEKILTELADACNETVNGSFALSRPKSKAWHIAFPNAPIATAIHSDLTVAVGAAIAEIKKHRTPLEHEVKFKI